MVFARAVALEMLQCASERKIMLMYASSPREMLISIFGIRMSISFVECKNIYE